MSANLHDTEHGLWAEFVARDWRVSVHPPSDLDARHHASFEMRGSDEAGMWTVRVSCVPEQLASRWSSAGAVGSDSDDWQAPTARLIEGAIRACMKVLDDEPAGGES